MKSILKLLQQRLKALSTAVLWMVFAGFIAMIGIAYFVYQQPPLFFPKWKQFQVYGIDVSKYQRSINWNAVEADGIEFAFMKASEGNWREDRCFESNWEDCGKTKIIRGAYHFYRADVAWEKQFENFTDNVQLKKGDLPPVVDIEDDEGVSDEKMIRDLKKFMRALEVYYGIKPILYTYESFYNDHFLNTFRAYNLWIASYSRFEPNLKDEAHWEFWQYSEEGSIKGIKSYVDLNCFYGSREDLLKLVKK